MFRCRPSHCDTVWSCRQKYITVETCQHHLRDGRINIKWLKWRWPISWTAVPLYKQNPGKLASQNHSVSQAVRHSVTQSVRQSVSQSVRTFQSVRQSETFSQAVRHSVSQSVRQSVSHNHSVSQALSLLGSQSVTIF